MNHVQRIVTLCLFAMAALLPACVTSSESVESPVRLPQRETTGNISTTTSLDYLLWLPDGYSSLETKQWPLVLFLHGAGERGDDLDRVKKWGPPKFAAAGQQLPYVLLAPQCPADNWWRPDALLKLLDKVEEEYDIDPDRIYVTGLSMGGFGTWDLASVAPDRFAAIAPICGGHPGPEYALDRLSGTPIWAFHGIEDTAVPLSRAVDPIERVRAAGGNPKLTVYNGVGHVSWPMAYADEEFWEWLMAQHR